MRRTVLLTLALATTLWGTSAPAQAPGPVLVVGDSLEVGTGPHLKRALRGRQVTVDAQSGRPSSEGVRVLRDLLRPAHRVVVFDLGTNDDPSLPRRLRSSLSAAQELVGKRCLVVSTLVRPAADGVSIEAMNRVIEEFASATPTVKVADWRAAAKRSPGLIGRDGVHATRSGYAARARVVADAVRSCSEEDGGRGSRSRSAGRGEAAPPLPQTGSADSLADLIEALPLELPLEAVRRVSELVERAVRQTQGAVIPIAPDATLGRPGDPLGRRSP